MKDSAAIAREAAGGRHRAGHISTASCIPANMAMKLGRTLTWDAQAGKIVGDDEANKLLARPYRAPWVHPGKVS
ncbi:MAG: hypothetical protein U0800_03310 [Isosphaeraceae bacterium]